LSDIAKAYSSKLNAVFENDLDVFHVGDLHCRIVFHDHQVGLFARSD